MPIPHRLSGTSSYLRNSTPKSIKKIHVKVDIASRHYMKTPAEEIELEELRKSTFLTPTNREYSP